MSKTDIPEGGDIVPTGVPGLDAVLGGGLWRSGLYMVEGRAGAGKTILASQMAFHRASSGEKVVYLTVLAESHGKLIRHLRQLKFFDETLIPARIKVLSGYQSLLEEGLDGLLRQLLRVVNEEAPSLLIIDGFRAAAAFAEDEKRLARFLHQLDGIVAGARCTTLLLSPLESNDDARPEHTLVDGLFALSYESVGLRRSRLLEVRKLRGADHIMGRHLFRISGEGVHVFPRMEARYDPEVHTPAAPPGRVAFGIPVLDEMMGGGVLPGSTTAILGPTGAGKTLMGLSFLSEGLRRGERAVYFGFFEDPERLLAKTDGVGLHLRDAVASGDLLLQWQPSLELVMDELGELLLRQTERTGTRRLFIDGIEGFRDSATHPERFQMLLTALMVYLRSAEVTTCFSQELPFFRVGSNLLDEIRMSAVTENILLLRPTIARSSLRRLLSILKMRDNAHDHDVREFTITDQGLSVGPRFEPDIDGSGAGSRVNASGGQ